MAAPVYRLRTPTGTGAEMLQFKSANGSRASRRWAKSGKTKTFPRGRRLKVYRASRWSAIGIIGDPAQKTVLDEAGFLMEAFTKPASIRRFGHFLESGVCGQWRTASVHCRGRDDHR